MLTKEIQIKDYHYALPDERIAKYPLAERDASKLLVYRHGEVSHTEFRRLPELLPAGALMVMNNTRVIQARLHFHKATGALIEVFLLEPADPVEYQENFVARHRCAWYCLVGNLKKWKEGALERTITIGQQQVVLRATRGEVHGTSHRIDFEWSCDGTAPSWAEVLEAMGELPIPPYLNRATEESDLRTYQTVYSKIKGSVAAPTAGLHFTERVLADIDAHGIERDEVTLHVGAGTFKPVKAEEIGDHEMHTEHIAVRRHTVERLLAHDGKAIAVGTTSVRTLESLYYMGLRAAQRMADGTDTGEGEELHVCQWDPYDGADGSCSRGDSTTALQALLAYMQKHELDVLHSSTQIIIAPGYCYHIVEQMVTNFHQPQSTLLLLVSAFVNGDWHGIYDYALAHDFRFLSYGDSSLLIP
ncbi:MAG: S-adenosylmethionine:tRNA ribosyltransferase-isomerase [Bacteroidaceae bacterium]|nr:S-adenosylmethionine:tRNA ribosyltransferase-isomerase [Bacteroidaceae bacterium]